MSNPEHLDGDTTTKLLVPDWLHGRMWVEHGKFVSSLGSEDPADFLRRKWSSEQPAAKARCGYGSSTFPSGIFELWDAANGRLPEPKPKRKPWASVRDFLAPKPGHSLSELDAETLKADLARARAAAADVGCEPTEAGLHDYLTACWGGNEARHRTFAEVFGTVWFK